MPTDQILDLMALAKALHKPHTLFRRSVSDAARSTTDSPANLAAIDRGTTALLEMETIVRHWTATNPPRPVPGVCGTPSPDGLFRCALAPHDATQLHADRTNERFEATGQQMTWETPVELPAGFERQACVTVACTACGYVHDEAEYTHHAASAGEALDEVVGAGWDELKDGRVLCETYDEKHEELRSSVGVVDLGA